MNRCPICNEVIIDNEYKCPKCGLDFEPFNKDDYEINERMEIKNYFGKGENILIPEGYTAIWSWAFTNDENLRTISLPDSLRRISSKAFQQSPVKHISFGSNLEEIGGNAFENSDIEEIYIESNKKLNIPMSYSFAGMKQLKKVFIKAPSIYMGSNVFTDSSSLEEVCLYGANDYGFFSFDGCIGLKKVYISKTTTHLVNFMFKKCPNLEKIYYEGTKEDFSKIGLVINEDIEVIYEISLEDYLKV